MLEVAGTVRLEVDGVPARLLAEGAELRLELDRLAWLSRSGVLRHAPALARLLQRHGLTLRVVWRRRTLLRLGAGAGIAGRLASLIARRIASGRKRPAGRGLPR